MLKPVLPVRMEGVNSLQKCVRTKSTPPAVVNSLFKFPAVGLAAVKKPKKHKHTQLKSYGMLKYSKYHDKMSIFNDVIKG